MPVYLEVVGPLENIVEDLKSLPPDRLEMAASFIRRLKPIARQSGKRLSPARSDASRRKKPTKWKGSSRKAASKSMNTAGSVLLDTNVVVAYFRGEQALLARFAGAVPLHLPWVVLGELYYGAQRASGGASNSLSSVTC